jgi:hypothetical protein
MTSGSRILNRIRASARRLARDESGQGTIEYILILSATVLGAAALGRAILGSLDRGVLFIGGTLEKDLKSGRAPLDVWKN